MSGRVHERADLIADGDVEFLRPYDVLRLRILVRLDKGVREIERRLPAALANDLVELNGLVAELCPPRFRQGLAAAAL